MEHRRIDFRNNDAYLLATAKDYIVINDNYRGLLVLDYELKPVSNIGLGEDIVFDHVFCRENTLLLFCGERREFHFVDLTAGEQRAIPLDGDWLCSPIYDWEGNEVTLFGYAGEKLRIDLKGGSACLAENGDSKVKAMIEKGIISYNREEKLAICANGAAALIDRITGRTVRRIPMEEGFHDYAVRGGQFMAVAEDKVLVLNGQNREVLSPRENCFFMRGRFFSREREEGFILLSGSKANARECSVEKYWF